MTQDDIPRVMGAPGSAGGHQWAPGGSRLPPALPALVGKKRVYGGWGMLVSYYLPGNSCAHPQGHRAGGSTARGVGAQAI